MPQTSRFERSLTLVHAADPASEILIAYEMNGEPLNPDHGAPFRLIVPHWYGVASVKWLKRIEVLTRAVHRRVRNRPLHVPVGRPAARARDGDAAARAHHRPAPGSHDRRAARTRRARQGVVWHRAGDERRHQPDGRIRVASGRTWRRRKARTNGRTGRSNGNPTSIGAQEPPRPGHRCRRERPAGSPPSGTGSATATTPSKSSTSTCDETGRASEVEGESRRGARDNLNRRVSGSRMDTDRRPRCN